MLNFHRTLTWLVSILPDPDTTFFYVLAVITFILFLGGFVFVEAEITKGKIAVFIDYFIFGNLHLMLDHVLLYLIICALITIVPMFFVFAVILGYASPEESNVHTLVQHHLARY